MCNHLHGRQSQPDGKSSVAAHSPVYYPGSGLCEMKIHATHLIYILTTERTTSMAAQKADIIVVDGETMDLFTNPLEEYWIKLKKKRPPFYALDVCRRGYIATWNVRDNQLFLTAVEGDVENRSLFGNKSRKFTLKELFKKHGPEGVKADWFSGKLRIPRGNMTQYEHNGYDSRFERELILTVNKGDVIKIATLDYTQRTLVVS